MNYAEAERNKIRSIPDIQKNQHFTFSKSTIWIEQWKFQNSKFDDLKLWNVEIIRFFNEKKLYYIRD